MNKFMYKAGTVLGTIIGYPVGLLLGVIRQIKNH